VKVNLVSALQQRGKERQSLNMIPMKVRQKKVDGLMMVLGA
jgi:hypothetical protein